MNDRFNEEEMTCNCYEEILSITLIPNIKTASFNVATRTRSADGMLLGSTFKTVEKRLPEDNDIFEQIISEYTADSSN